MIKITKKQLIQYEQEWRQHTRDMKNKKLHDLIYPTLDAYIKSKFGFKHQTDQFKELVNKQSYRRDCVQIESRLATVSANECAAKATIKYTGTYVKGISITHKSNLVPVTSQEQSIDIAHMLR